MSNQLIEIKKYLTTKDIKNAVEDNYIEMIVSLHPKCRKSAFVDYFNAVQLSGANPAKNQVYFTSYFSKKLGYSIGTTVFSYRFFEDTANQIAGFQGCTCEISTDDYFNPVTGKNTKTLKAVAIAKRKDREDIIFVAWYPEFAQTDFHGSPTATWKRMPYLMLRKCAIAGALRSAFPETIGTYLIEEEVNKEYNEDAEKIVQLETDIETTATEIKQTEEIIERSKDYKSKPPLIENIRELSGKITSHMTLEEKTAWMNSTLLVDSFKRLEGWSIDQLKSTIDKLAKIVSEPIVVGGV